MFYKPTPKSMIPGLKTQNKESFKRQQTNALPWAAGLFEIKLNSCLLKSRTLCQFCI
jgi:hypothetical protein